MHICMVLAHTYPPDVRIEKEVKSLRTAGHTVSLLCRGSLDAPTREHLDGMHVVRIEEESIREKTRRLSSAAVNLLANVHPLWVRELEALVEETDADAIHVHDLPLVREGVVVGERTGIPVVADLHENYPEAIRLWREPHSLATVLDDPEFAIHWALKPVSRYKRIERRCVKAADRVVTVTEEAATHYHHDCALSPFRSTVVSNTVNLDRFTGEADPVAGYEDDFVISYVGTFGTHRGLTTAVKAMADIVAEVPNARLLLVGAGSEPYERQLRDLASEYGVEAHVTFAGWVDFDEFPAYMAASDVCLVPHVSTPHTNTTIPHKLFQYMAMCKPVIVTDLPPLSRVVTDTDVGHVIEPENETDLAEAAIDLATNPETAAQLGENGRQAVEDRYNWEHDGQKLVAMYESLVESE
ncbi:glycosyltransferase family 4 protein [Haladaptatus sp. GCM10025707]|uniref:glycosyltransferase family 4 protein n=2 Tax=unclassified Haladaptatus TaxID=2622732 RepID=UPI0023E7F3BD|nr:glycosyltransferase family 4 protein [Haladaptatus sp. QDMS2]